MKDLGRPTSIAKASGFQGERTSEWWTKGSKYGVKYQCSSCGKITLGMRGGDTMHLSTCLRRQAPAAQPPAEPPWDPMQASALLSSVPDDLTWDAERFERGEQEDSADYVDGFNDGLAHARRIAAQLRVALAKIETLE